MARARYVGLAESIIDNVALGLKEYTINDISASPIRSLIAVMMTALFDFNNYIISSDLLIGCQL